MAPLTNPTDEQADWEEGAAPMLDQMAFSVFAPRALPGAQAAIEAAAEAYGLVEPLVLAHWLGQMHADSHGFSILSESLDHSVDDLLANFDRRRISAAACARYGRTANRAADTMAIANIVYGGNFGRTQLGNTEPGDGWRFRGGGLQEIVGRAAYREAGYAAEPDILRTDVEAAALDAARLFVKHGCIGLALADNVRGVTLNLKADLKSLPERAAATIAARPLVGLP